MFNPPMQVIAARDHIMHVVYSFLQPSRVLDRFENIIYQFLTDIKCPVVQEADRQPTKFTIISCPAKK